MSEKPVISIIMGSDSDLTVMKEAADVLAEFGVPYEIDIISAHRTPDRLFEYGKSAAGRGIKAIIAGAGSAAALPGVLASITTLPVIGVPISGKVLDGMDALLSMVQMPTGIPVATVAINGAKNAGLLALRQLAAFQPEIMEKMVAYQAKLGASVNEKSARLQKVGINEYLTSK